MPLSHAVERELLHQRDIALRGYRRSDGLFEIEATIADTKTYSFANENRGRIAAGEKLHGMALRMTFDEDLVITGFEAVSEYTPYDVCPNAAASFSRLAGLKIGPGFMKGVHERVGGTVGCTHLRELVQQMATVAFQTLYPVRRRREAEGKTKTDPAKPPALLGTCYAYAPDSPIVGRRWPKFYKGPPLEDAGVELNDFLRSS